MGARRLAEGVGTVYVRGENGFDMVPFAEGEDIPKWAADQMGAHCFKDGDASSDAASAGGQGDQPKAIAEMNAKELKAEIARRNEGRAEEGLIAPTGKKNVDMVAALEADDAASAGA